MKASYKTETSVQTLNKKYAHQNQFAESHMGDVRNRKRIESEQKL